jgi:hypothetical protein
VATARSRSEVRVSISSRAVSSDSESTRLRCSRSAASSSSSRVRCAIAALAACAIFASSVTAPAEAIDRLDGATDREWSMSRDASTDMDIECALADRESAVEVEWPRLRLRLR